MRPTLKTTLAIALLVSLGAITITWSTRASGESKGASQQTDPAPPKQTDYARAKEEAERYYASGSYERAHEIYSKIDKTALPPAEQRWVEFRIADTLWRGPAATNTVDPTKFEQAQKRLEELIRATDKEDERDLVWVMAHESLGDFFWRRDQMNWGGAWPHYQQALDWWAGQRDVDQARDRYLSIVFRAADPPNPHEYYHYTYYGNYLPLTVLENALKISRSEQDKAHLHFLIAMTMRHTSGDWELLQGVAEEYEAALAQGKKADWYDDALFFYAAWMSNQGTVRQIDNGQWIHEPDYVKALELLRRLTTEFRKGETRYYDQAIEQIQAITQPTINITVSNIFLPTSELQFNLSARNLPRVDFSLYKIDLTRDVSFIKDPEQDEGEGEDGSPTWLKTVQLAGRTPVKVWSENLKEARDHQPISKELRIEGKLPFGAYLLEGRNGKSFARDLVLVTDTSVVLKSAPRQALVYVCDAVSGAPARNAQVVLWEGYYQDSKWRWRRQRQSANKDGLTVFKLSGTSNYRSLFAAASSNERQSFSLGRSYTRDADPYKWRIYAFTDRPAYRPTETVQWKFVARRFGDGVYSTPANEIIEYQINDPRGTKVSEGQAPLNSFGSAWGSLELGAQLPLGEYNIVFWDHGRKNHIGNAKLFRLEEYKLPEFKVAVKTPEENGKRRGFRIGEKVEVSIQADYYFGGPVPNASVEVVVYQNFFAHYWNPRREYPWYYSDLEANYSHYFGSGQAIKRETIKTDSSGKATLTFDTPRTNYNQDYEYRIEARVTDSSRREIVASNTVRVTRQRYYVYARPQQNIYRPQDKVKVDIKALDANDQPVTTPGTVKITRDYWYEVWIDPTGREAKGEELRKLGTIPLLFTRGPQPWRLKFRGYKHDDIATVNVKTDENGSAEVSFIPERDGYYRLEWQSSQQTEKRNRILPQIKTETRVFVATNATTELGYRHSGVGITVDKDTFRAGQIAPVMLTVPTNDRYVLFSVEGEDLYSYQLVHVSGTAKLIELPIDEKHVPNIFLAAAMVSSAGLSVDTKQVVVPPANQFLSVNVRADREQYQPREDGTLSITTRDGNGKPVAAEVALGLIDESVSYIQQDYAGDPRQFYYGTKRAQLIQTQSTFQQKTYARLVDAGKGRLIDGSKDAQLRDEDDAVQEISEFAAAPAGVGAGARADNYRLNALTKSEARPSGTLQSPTATPAPMDVERREPAVQVRSDFRTTVLWQPDVKTDANGFATVKVKYPDSLTTWQAIARVATAGNQFGMGSASTRTKQPLIVRLQAPRFFVVGDQVTVSAVINNNTDQAMKVAPSLSAEGLTVSGQAVAGQSLGDRSPVEVKANSEARVDWRVSVTHASEAKIKVQARGDAYADAMEKTFSIYEHGIEKFISRSGKMRGSSVAVTLDIPRERRADSTVLTVQVAPSMATTMIDALPYLVDYPYGCTEQTMSRFLPAVITAKTLRDLGLKPEVAMHKVFGGIEQSSAGASHPKGKHDLRELDEMTREGLERLYGFQHADGGWGWWKDGESDHFMTAYVVWGMTLAREAGIDVKSDVLTRAAAFLDQELVEEEKNYDIQSWMLHALAVHHAFVKPSEVSKFQAKAFENLWSSRDRLNAYTRALLALAAHKFGFSDKAKTLVENLENGVKIDSRPDTSIVQSGSQSSDPSVIATAHWGEDGLYWRWSEGGVEATSFALRALLAIDPNHRLIEPVTNWLIKNRRGSQWSNTRDTAIVVLTLNDYLRTTREVQTELGYDLLVNGTTVATKQINAEDALGAPTKFNISRELIKDGGNEITIRRTSGTGPLYFSAQATFFSLEEPVKPAGNEIFVRRQYFKLVNHPTLLKGHVSERVPLSDGETVKSGDRIEVVLTIEGKNNYEYLLFEDLKPAGLEAVQIRSGASLFVKELKSGAFSGKNAALMNFTAASDFTGRSRWVYQELRDRKVALFIDQLPEGVWQLSYELRAESPGTFHALPVLGHAMYVPEIRTNGGETRISVVD